MRDASERWLDWALLMNQKYPRGSLKFTRTEEKKASLQAMQGQVTWANVLLGRSLDEFMSKFRPKVKRTSRRILNRAHAGGDAGASD